MTPHGATCVRPGKILRGGDLQHCGCRQVRRHSLPSPGTRTHTRSPPLHPLYPCPRCRRQLHIFPEHFRQRKHRDRGGIALRGHFCVRDHVRLGHHGAQVPRDPGTPPPLFFHRPLCHRADTRQGSPHLVDTSFCVPVVPSVFITVHISSIGRNCCWAPSRPTTTSTRRRPT